MKRSMLAALALVAVPGAASAAEDRSQGAPPPPPIKITPPGNPGLPGIPGPGVQFPTLPGRPTILPSGPPTSPNGGGIIFTIPL